MNVGLARNPVIHGAVFLSANREAPIEGNGTRGHGSRSTSGAKTWWPTPFAQPVGNRINFPSGESSVNLVAESWQ